jgi:hypothetical protein
MNLGILQISDIHCRSGQGALLADRTAKICSAIKLRCAGLKCLLLVISGDISFSGTPDEFVSAGQWLHSLILDLTQELGVPIVGPVLVPGNHDCDFGQQGGIRPVLLRSISENLSSLDHNADQVREMCRVQDSFFVFEQGYSKVMREGISRLYYARIFEADGKEIIVHCFNTAWVSVLKEKQGSIVLPSQIALESSCSRPILAISVFHHPYEWFAPANRRLFRKLVEGASDLVLTGHEHEGDHFDRKSSGGASVSYIEGAAFSAEGTDVGFNLIVISPGDHTSQVFTFLEKDSIYQPKDDVTIPFLRNPALASSFVVNNETFENELLRCPVSFSSSNKDDLRIDDIFVYPDLKATSFIDKKATDIRSEAVLPFIVDTHLVHIAGAVMSGKTTMARKLYVDLREYHNYVPLLLSGDEIPNRPGGFSKVRDAAFSKQYSSAQLERFIQLPATGKALIIDDWHRVRLNKKGKAEFLALARKEFGVVVTFGTEQTWLEDMLATPATEEIIDFQHCTIREFGYRLREQMLFKWHSLGREYEVERAQLIKDVARSGALLNGILGKGFFPAFPLFILYSLQTISVDQSNLRIHGSYGHIYETFITQRLALVVSKPQGIGTYYSYLSMIAYELFVRNKSLLTREEIREVHDRFVESYGIPWDLDSTLSKLEPTGIFGETPDGFAFMQKYCYFFFVAKYFQKARGDNPQDEKTHTQLREMAEMVHDHEYMNILIFYLYLTEDRQLIEFLIKQAEQVFAEHKPVALREDVAFLNDLLQPRKLDLGPTDVEANRQAFASQQDRAEAEMEKIRETSARTRYGKALAFSLKMDFANHSLQVMGQVLKNFPGDIKADLKNALAKESYLLGMRTTTAVLDLLRENVELIRSMIEQVIRFHRAKRDDAAAARAGKVFAYLAEGAILGYLKRISSAVGIEDLEMTYAAVRRHLGESNLSVRMIDLAIRLDHFSKIPHSDISDLAEDTKSHLVAYNIMLMLLIDHLHLFEVDYKERQKLSKYLGSATQPTLLTDKRFKLGTKSR